MTKKTINEIGTNRIKYSLELCINNESLFYN